MTTLDLQQDELLQVVEFFARGYTIRYIHNHLMRRAAERSRPDLVPEPQDLLRLAVRYADNIEQIRGELAKDALRVGLARKEERIRRLSEAAEAIEPQVISGMNLKATEGYRKLLQSIHDEVEPLKLIVITPDDPWAQLLTSLKERRDLRATGDLPNSLTTLSTSEEAPREGKLTLSSITSSEPDTSPPTEQESPAPTPINEASSTSPTEPS
jgi:hypothetical protein